MSVWAIGDLHLSFGVANKSMDVFGDQWASHAQKIEANWKEKIQGGDLVLIPGDISWAMRFEDALIDLSWIDQLPGTKVIIRGNHDYWWSSISKMAPLLPPSIHLLQNSAYHWNGVGIAGTRLWDSEEYNFNSYILRKERADGQKAKPKEEIPKEESEKIFQREIHRLELSLKCLKPEDKTRIVMTHYPPISATLDSSRTSQLLEKYEVDFCLFGHLHNVQTGMTLFGKKEKTRYILTSADYLNFSPIKIS